MSKEVWDAYNKRGNKLGFDLYRGEKIPEDTYHIIVEVYVFTNEKEVLITQRHPNKPWGLKWEITGGSILKGETPKLGAVRELQEETGIVVNEDDLIPIYTVPNKDFRSIYYSFATIIDKAKTKIILQDGETIDFRVLSYENFKWFIKTDDFVNTIRDRFFKFETMFEKILKVKQTRN